MMNIPNSLLSQLDLFAMLHDIGKVAVDDKILSKPGPLTSKERSVMETHPEIGYRIVKSSAELAPVAEYILYHHERWDGKGYPHGLSGDKIPLLSRVLAVVDAFDAMTHDRVYRKAMPVKGALAEIQKNSGTQFDPEVVKAFTAVIEKEF
jgi:HD-GYP domain-containing protein (c-di-GMP phosphodiesterase class II)